MAHRPARAPRSEGPAEPAPPLAPGGLLSADAAARALGVRKATLYAYVSRGLVRSEARTGGRARGYRAEDLAALRRQRAGRRDPSHAAEEALHFGAPVLESGLTRIADGGLWYRGLPVETLVDRPFESVAALLWGGFPDVLPPLPAGAPATEAAAALPPLPRFQVALAELSAHDPAAFDLEPEAVRRSGAGALRLLAALAAGAPVSRRPVAEVLARGWAPRRRGARALLDAALVCWADHELNPSTFTVRCVASARAQPYAALGAGLSALGGALHGGMTERVEALLDEVREPARARAACEARLRRGEALPGFGHPLYAGGDPRARLLLERLRGSGAGRRSALALAEAVEAAARDLTGRPPNVDFAVVALRRALGAPPRSALALVAVARSVGWIGHVLEQLEGGRLVRPRARYVGPAPKEPEEVGETG